MNKPIEETSELRKDPVLDRWVIIAASRGKRPHDFATTPEETKSAGCPFCGGNETKTPPEIYAVRPTGSLPNAPGWEVRVVQNKFPALTIEASLTRSGIGLLDRMGGFGAHEVIIETPEHGLDRSNRRPSCPPAGRRSPASGRSPRCSLAGAAGLRRAC